MGIDIRGGVRLKTQDDCDWGGGGGMVTQICIDREIEVYIGIEKYRDYQLSFSTF